MKTYRVGSVFHAESAIFGYGWSFLVGLEKHLPNVFVRRAEELSQRLVFGRVELPQIANPLSVPKPVDLG